MKRARWVWFLLATVGVALGGNCQIDKPTGLGESLKEMAPKPSGPVKATRRKIGYIRPAAPDVDFPVEAGTQYRATVPDTLDLAERARLAIRGMTNVTDPDADYEIYWTANFWGKPPTLYHDADDSVQAKFMEDMPLLRMMTGDETNHHVERAWMQAFLRMIGPDGLAYIPVEGRPWARRGMDADHGYIVWGPDGKTVSVDKPAVTQLGQPHMWNGRMLGAMSLYYLRDRNPMWEQICDAMIQRLSKLVIDKGSYAYFPIGFFQPNARVAPDAGMPKGAPGAESGAPIWVIQGLAQYYKTTGYQPARELAVKLTNCLRRDDMGNFDSEGRFVDDYQRTFVQRYMSFYNSFFEADGTPKGGGHEYVGPSYRLFYLDGRPAIDQRLIGAHFHRHTYGLLALLEFALATGDRELLEFVRKGYDYGRASGSSLVGFFPECIVPNYPTSETCEVADMIALALKLTEAGVQDGWDDVDRWVRNQFVENQLTRCDWVSKLHGPPTVVAEHQSGDRACERNIGTFAGWPSANDWSVETPYTPPIGTMHCCVGNGARTLYYVWQRMIEKKDDTLWLHLLLNRASPWADVDSFIPYQGKVRLKMKQPFRSLWIRAPEWVASGSGELVASVDAKPRRVRWEGRYVDVGGVSANDRVEVSFPIKERTVQQLIGGILYTLIFRGNEVVSIDPPGKNDPLYQRSAYRQSVVRWKSVDRFVSERDVRW